MSPPPMPPRERRRTGRFPSGTFAQAVEHGLADERKRARPTAESVLRLDAHYACDDPTSPAAEACRAGRSGRARAAYVQGYAVGALVRWLFSALAVAALCGAALGPALARARPRLSLPTQPPPPGSLGGYCAGNRDCATIGFRDCTEHTCRAYCWMAGVSPDFDLVANCEALGGSCAASGECVR